MKRYIRASKIIVSLTPPEQYLVKKMFDDCDIKYTESRDQSTEDNVVYNELVILEEPRTASSSGDYELLQDKMIELEVNHNIRDDGFGREHRFYKCMY